MASSLSKEKKMVSRTAKIYYLLYRGNETTGCTIKFFSQTGKETESIVKINL
jgi:hypothetical protein